MSNFDLRKYLAENTLVTEDKIDMINKYAQRIATGEEIQDEFFMDNKEEILQAADEIEKYMGSDADIDEVKKPSMKMKKSELKEMIKAAFLSEADFTNAQDDDAALGGMYDPVYEAEDEEETAEREETAEEILARITGTKLDPYSLAEAKDEEEEMDITVDAEEETTDGGEGKLANDSIVVDKKIVSLSSLPQQTRKILDSLETLRAQAEEFGDQKFITQVGNTITFFTRDFVVAGDEPTKAKVDEVESKELKVGEKVDVFNKGGKYQGWGRNEYLYNSEIVDITGEKVTVKDINDDEYEVDSSDISKLDESVAFPMWNKIK
jgi:hypothetical protein